METLPKSKRGARFPKGRRALLIYTIFTCDPCHVRLRLLSTLYKFFQICTIAENFFPRSHSSFILHRFPFLRTTSPAVHLAERRLYGYFADHHTSIMRARNAGLSSLQGFSAGSEWRIFDLSDVQFGDHSPGAFTGGG